LLLLIALSPDKYIYLVYTAKHTIFIEKNMVHPSPHTTKTESKEKKRQLIYKG